MERPSLDSSIDSEIVPPEKGVDRFRNNEDEDTFLPILSSVSRGITVTEAGICTLWREEVAVDEVNSPTPDNFIQYDDVLPTL